MTTEHTSAEILADPNASPWLKVALLSLKYRDPGDALADAETLVDVLAEEHKRNVRANLVARIKRTVDGFTLALGDER